jgi:murein DD-endopeptidase MepM/ murein hydrolase activator NlpD
MIKSFFKKSPFTIIIILLLLFLIPGFSFFLYNNSSNNTSLIKSNASSFLLPHSSFLKTGTYYRVAGQDPSLFPDSNFLLLRCLFPSERLLNRWGYEELNKPDTNPLVTRASFAPLTSPDMENLRQEIDLGDEIGKMEQAVSAQPRVFSGADQEVFMISDLDLKGLVKPTGKLMINAKYPNYCFPVSWPFFFRDSFGDPRGPNRLHIGIDIFAEEGTQVYAMTDGVIQSLVNCPNAGNTILLRGKDGRGYIYMHLQRYAEGLSEGKAVKKGELIAYVGHTGTISSPPHLHFQVHSDQSFSKTCAIDPYPALISLCQGHGVTDLGQPKPHFSMARGPDIPLFPSNLANTKKSGQKDYSFVVNKPVSIKTALIKGWDVKSSPPSREPGRAGRVPDPAWKVPQADLKVPAAKEPRKFSYKIDTITEKGLIRGSTGTGPKEKKYEEVRRPQSGPGPSGNLLQQQEQTPEGWTLVSDEKLSQAP